MPYSYQNHVVGTATAGPFSFAAIDGYLSIDHIKVYVDGALQSSTTYTVNESLKEITFDESHPTNTTILIKRETPKLLDQRDVVFSSGAIVRPDDLNRAHLQTMFIAQETEDYAVKDVDPETKQAGYVLTWNAIDEVWQAAEPTGGEGGSGVTPGIKGDINVVTTSDWQIRPDVVSTTELGGDITAAGKSMLTAANASAQRSLISAAEASHTHSTSDITGLDILATTGQYADVKGTPTEASVSTSGLMAAADKSKLDGIQAGAEVNVQSDWNAATGDAHILNKPTLGTASALNVPATPGASAGSTQVVRGDDPRLSDSRSPTYHTHTANDITSGLAEVAKTGEYSDLINKPTIPVNIGDLGNVSNATPTSGYVLKWNGSEWAPAVDATSGGGGGGDASTLEGQPGSYYLNRTNHTGTQAISTIVDLQTELNGKAPVSHTQTLSSITDAGTAAARNVPVSGNAGIVGGVAEVVIADDTRLSDARTPTAHSHVISDVTDLTTTLDGKASASPTYFTLTDESSGLPNSIWLIPGAGLEFFAPVGGSRIVRCLFGTSAGTVCQGDDARLSDSRTPTGHTHSITDCYVGHVEEPPAAGKDYFLDLECPVNRTVTKVTAKTTGGTCNISLYRDGTLIGEINGVNSSTESFITPSINNTISAGETLKLTVGTVSSAANLHFTVRYTQLSGSN